MHPRIAELLDYLEAQTANLRDAFECVPPDRRRERPTPDRWSPAEIVHHLAIVERRVGLRLAGLIEQARALPPESDTTTLFPMANATRVEVRNRRLKAPEAAEPRDTDPTRVWDDLLEARAALRTVIATGDGLQLGAVTAPHPFLGDFTGYEWIVFVGAHATRHADQIREIAADTVQP